MRRNALATTVCLVSIFSGLHASSAIAQDLIWQVENPFRFFKRPARSRCTRPRSTRCAAIRRRCPPTSSGAPSAGSTIPTARIPRTPDHCAATAGKRYQQSRLGWAAQTVGDTCYESNGRPRRYLGGVRAQVFLGHAPRKTTSCPTRTRSRSRSRRSSSPA